MPVRLSAQERGYTSRWSKARKTYLLSHPLCVMCQQDGRIKAAEVVDHIIPHRQDQTLFWDVNNWQSLCKLHHDSTKQREEKSGLVVGADKDGIPTDPNHHWNK